MRGLQSVNVLLAMLITVTVFSSRFSCYRLKYIRNCFIISILYIISLKVYCLLLRIWGYPSTFTPVVCLQHISNWQHHFWCSRRSTEHIYIGHYLYSFHAHGTLFCALSVRTNMEYKLYVLVTPCVCDAYPRCIPATNYFLQEARGNTIGLPWSCRFNTREGTLV